MFKQVSRAICQEIGQNNFRAAVALYDGGYYRNATSRSHYAAFCILTHELVQRGAAVDFREQRATPGHAQLPRLMTNYFTQFSPERLDNLIGYVAICTATELHPTTHSSE